MKTKILFLFLVLILSKVSLTGQNNLLPIDSLYISKIDEFYQNAIEFKDKAWIGMELSPICIFRKNGPVFTIIQPPNNFKNQRYLYQGTQAELQLIGATSGRDKWHVNRNR